MSFIKASELGLYAPKTNEGVKAKTEAQKYINEAIFHYKQLFYGLRLVAWRCRDKGATFYEALSYGELEEFKLAPGHRLPNGSYSKSEWDNDRLNAYMWNRFRERFDAAFNLEVIYELKTLKDIKQATDELLEFTLTNWGQDLLGNGMLDEFDSIEPISNGVTSCKLEYRGIKITGKFYDTERTLCLNAKGLPEVIIQQTKGTESWKDGIHFDPFGEVIIMDSKSAELFSEMLNLAARLNAGIEDFMANPDSFLGLESAEAHKRNLQLIKEKLIIVNRDAFEKRKVESETVNIRQINEMLDADKTDDTPFVVEETTPVQQTKKLHKNLTRKQQKELEAATWLAQNSSELDEDIDTQLGLSTVDDGKLIKEASADLSI